MAEGSTHWLSLPGSDADKRAYARVMGHFILETETIPGFAELVAYLMGVAIDLSNRQRLLTLLAPLVAQIRASRLDDTGHYFKRGDPLPPELAAAPVRVACPRAYADIFKLRQDAIEAALQVDRKLTFKEFAKLAFLIFDRLLIDDPKLMSRVLKAWPQRYFGL